MVKKTAKKAKSIKVDLKYTDRHKVTTFPWKQWEDKSVEEFNCSEIFQYIPQTDRLKFMEELYRILADDGKAVLLTNYYSSSGACADYEIQWPPICEQSFLFFNKEWRKQNELSAPIKCNFDFTYGYAWTPEVASRTTDVQVEFVKHRLNVAHKLQVVLTKVKEK